MADCSLKHPFTNALDITYAELAKAIEFASIMMVSNRAMVYAANTTIKGRAKDGLE